MIAAREKTFMNSKAYKRVADIALSTQRHSKRVLNLLRLAGNKVDVEVAPSAYWVLGRRSRCRLLYFHPHPGVEQSKKTVLLTPSLINRYYILDLYTGNSVIESLLKKGVQVYLIDWESPREHDQFATLEDHILNWLDWAVERTRTHAKVERVKLFGQCVGGTFAAIYTALHQEKIESLALLTTPVDFSAKGILGTWANKSRVDLAQMVEVWGNIKEDFLDQSFKYIHPMGEFKKRKNLIQLSWNEDFIRKYHAIERWLSDGIAFPGQTYHRFIDDMYIENKLINNKFKLDGREVNLSSIKCPVVNIWAKGDSIVPKESSQKLSGLLKKGQIEEYELGGGHIGCLISDKHSARLFSLLGDWALEDPRLVSPMVH